MKTPKFIPNSSDIKEVDGEKYVKMNAMAHLDGLMLDNFQIMIHRTMIKVYGRKCFFCGEDFKGRIKELTEHHSIPRTLKPKYNMTIPVCKYCHQKINDLYIRQQKKSESNNNVKDFDKFKDNYEKLRNLFKSGKLDRGNFGEGLWKNLMNYLEKISGEK